MTEPIATIYWYKVGVTDELTRDQEAELGSFALTLINDSKNRIKSSVVAGKIGEEEVYDFAPDTISSFEI